MTSTAVLPEQSSRGSSVSSVSDLCARSHHDSLLDDVPSTTAEVRVKTEVREDDMSLQAAGNIGIRESFAHNLPLKHVSWMDGSMQQSSCKQTHYTTPFTMHASSSSLTAAMPSALTASNRMPMLRQRMPQPPLWDMIVTFPDELASDTIKFNDAMKNWMCDTIDKITVPIITRSNGLKIIPTTIVQTKFYSQFGQNVVNTLANTLKPLNSYYLDAVEAWMFNVINSTVFNYSLGLKVFESKEECLNLHEVELQYWKIKKYSLEQILAIYGDEVPPGTLFKRNVTGIIVKMKKDAYNEIRKIDEIIKGRFFDSMA